MGDQPDMTEPAAPTPDMAKPKDQGGQNTDANDPDLWKMGVVLGTTDSDSCRPQNERLSGILSRKNIGHWLDIRPNRSHDWPVWKEMFPHYLSLLPGTSA